MEGKDKPDYARCVDIVTKAALKEMVLRGNSPRGRARGAGFRLLKFVTKEGVAPQSVAALLMVGTIAGILMALFMNNGGGAWDNAKKYIETGQYGWKGLGCLQKQPSSATPLEIHIQGYGWPLLARADQAIKHRHLSACTTVHLSVTQRAKKRDPCGALLTDKRSESPTAFLMQFKLG